MALSEFMPYGAPELLDGARTRMARSTLFASLAVGLLVAGMGSLVSRGVRLIDPVEISPIINDLMPPVLDPPLDYASRPIEPARQSFDPNQWPMPVPDRLAPPDIADDPPVLPVGPVGDPPAGPVRPEAPGHGVAPSGDDPAPGVYVHYDEPPTLVHSVDAIYPDLAREAGVEGLVRVLMLVGLDGRVKRGIVAPGGSIPMLDDAALEAARECVFTPALSNNHPVKVWVARNYRFSLH